MMMMSRKTPTQNYTNSRYGRASQSSARNTKKHFRRHANTNRFSGLETDDEDASETPRTPPPSLVLEPTPDPTASPSPSPSPGPGPSPSPSPSPSPGPTVSCVKHYGDRYADQTYHLMYGSQRIESAALTSPVVLSSWRKKTGVAISVNADADADADADDDDVRDARLSMQFNAMASYVSSSTSAAVSFFGKCFYCHYLSHSQKYCPLRQCQRCKRYGHAENVCGFPLP